MNVKKTPVSMLQEMMVKKGTAPAYELIQNEEGTHQNIFTYEVTCIGLKATGTGRCKKDAKHEAATAMLETIAKHNPLPQLPAATCESPVRTPLPMELPVLQKSPPHVPFTNTIGVLQELCTTNNLDNPEYKEISDVGPPHARVFTYHCIVSTFVEEGIATTKKQARHEAARKMIEKISGLVVDEALEDQVNEVKRNEQLSSQLAMARYPVLSMIHNAEIVKSKINWGLKVKDFHKKLKESFGNEQRNELLVRLGEMLDLISQYQNQLCEEKNKQLKEDFEILWSSVETDISLKPFPSSSESEFIILAQLHTAPDITEFGIGKTQMEAEVLALKNVLNTVILLIQ